MPFISSNSGDANGSTEDKIEFISDQQVQAMLAYNATSAQLQSEGHPARCIKCNAEPERLQYVTLDNFFFACQLKVPVCRQCAKTHPFEALEVNRSAWTAGALLVSAIGLWIVSQVLLGLICFSLAGAAVVFLRPYCLQGRRQREIGLLKLLRESERYQRLVEAIPHTKLILPLDNDQENYAANRENESLRNSFGWKWGFHWLLVDHQFERDTASTAVISTLLEILVEELKLFASEYKGRKDFILRLQLELLDHRRRKLRLDGLPRLDKRKIERFISKLEALPSIPVNGPISLQIYYARDLGTKLYRKLPNAVVSDELLFFR